MSARGPVGATNRADLFSSRSQPSQREADPIPSSSRDRLQGDYGVASAEEDPLQLEHMLGYAGNFRKTLLSLPCDENIYVKRFGVVAYQNNFVHICS